jgi:hypothetical protein
MNKIENMFVLFVRSNHISSVTSYTINEYIASGVHLVKYLRTNMQKNPDIL